MKYFCLLILIVLIFTININGFAESPDTPGKLIFNEMPQLPLNWWKKPSSAWNTWDENSYYLWGANLTNYKISSPTKKLKGSGMASSEGPTRGRGHPQFIGIIVTSLSFRENEAIFSFLENKLRDGANVVVPVINGRYALGTGVAFRRHRCIEDWYTSQKYLFEKMIHLSSIAQEVTFQEGVFWPDCGFSTNPESPQLFSIESLEDIKSLHHYVGEKSTHLNQSPERNFSFR